MRRREYRIMRDTVCKFNGSIANTINCTQFIYETGNVQSSSLKAATHFIGIILKGKGCITLDENTVDVGLGDVYVIRKGSVFSIRLDEDMAYSYIAFNGFRADELMERIGASEKSLVFSGHRDIIDFWMTCFDKSDNCNLDLFGEAALLFTVANLSKKNKNKSELSERITEYINDNFSNSKLNISELAKEFGYEKKYISAVFKAQKGVTFTEYLRNIRIRHAAFLFEEGIESVNSVAMLSGFSDAFYFSKLFKNETGMSPTDYIKHNGRSKENGNHS